jgi:type I restriction enzyme, S subunit
MKRDLPKYPKYKSSGITWVGSIPAAWSIYKLKFCADIVDCKNRTPEVLPDGKFLVVRTTNVKSGRLILDGAHYTDENNFRDWTKRGIPAAGSVLFTREAPAGEVCLVPEDLPLCLGQRMMNFIPHKNLLSGFASYFFQSKGVSQFIEASSDGSTVSHLRVRQVYDFPICLPSIIEQKALVAFLNRETAKIDRLIQVRREQLERLQEQRMAVIHYAVTKGLDPKARMKSSSIDWLGEVPETWAVKKMRFAVKFKGGGTPSKDNLAFWAGTIPWVSPKDMQSFLITDAEDHITSAALSESATSLIDHNSVLMVVRSGILRRRIPVAINSLDVALNQDMKALQPKTKLLPQFLMLLIHGNEEQLLTLWRKQGSTVESLEHHLMADTFIPIPPLQEQQAIVAHIERETHKIDALTEKYRREIELLEEYRAALISHAVTGKIDVRGVVTEDDAQETL